MTRYLYLCLGGCALAVLTMGVYSVVLFIATSVFTLLVCSLCPVRLHARVFWAQMLWQTLCHLLIHYREGCLHQGVSVRSGVSSSPQPP